MSGAQVKTAIIVAVNPMPRIYIRTLVESLQVTHEQIKILTFYRTTLFDRALENDLVLAGAAVHQYAFDGRVDEFRQLRRATKLLKSWQVGEGTDVFHCQPNHFLTNYLTFGLPIRRGASVHLIPDGVANFYDTGTAPYEKAMQRKKLIAPLIGLSFHPYQGNYLALGTANYESYWYFGEPGIMATHLPLHEFPAPAPPSNLDAPRGALFLGHPGSGAPEFDDQYDAVLRAAARLVEAPVYKPHPAETIDGTRRARLHMLGYSIIETDAPAEVLAARYETVMGVASSVLFNVRMLGWCDRVLCLEDPLALSLLLGRNEREVEQILSAARSAGIHTFGI